MFFQTTDISQALKSGEISHSEIVFPSAHVYFNGGEANPHLTDIFGKHHKAFRPYEFDTQDFMVHVLPDAYCFSHHEIVFTKSKKILVTQTSYPTHPLLPQDLFFTILGGGDQKTF